MSLHSLVAFVREKSPFYRELYKTLPSKLPTSDAELLALLPDLAN